jgi:pimeloyl-[acyl-carrier protein] methyl ester esterase
VSTALHVETAGAGPDLALIHGWGLHGRIWGDVADRLAGAFTLHLVDLPGHGASPPVRGGWGAWTQALADALPPAHVLGWSLGGQLALSLAATRPERVRSLALVSSTPRFVTADGWPWGVGADMLRGFAAQLRRAPEATLARFLALQTRGDAAARAAARALRTCLHARPMPTADALRDALALLAGNDLRAQASAVTAPVLVLYGECDPLVPPAAAQWLLAALPQARARAFAGATHAPFVSAPVVFAHAVEHFVNEAEQVHGDSPRRRASR